MTVLTIILSLMMAAAPLQQPSLVDSFRQNASNGCVFVEYDYSIILSGVKTKGSGGISVQGDSYHMKGNGVEIFCDGTSTWLIDEAAGEVVIESAISDDAGFLANPVMLLMNLDQMSLSYKVDGNRISIVLSDGTQLEIVVNDMKSEQTKKTEDFRPPYKFNSDWIVTDLR